MIEPVRQGQDLIGEIDETRPGAGVAGDLVARAERVPDQVATGARWSSTRTSRST